MDYQKTRIKELFAFDKIRLGKIVEFFQSSLVSVLIVSIFGYLFKIIKREFLGPINKDENLFIMYLKISIEVFLISVLLFYLRKLIMIVPSVASYLVSGFKPYTTMDYTMSMCIVIIIIELFSDLKEDLDVIKVKFDFYRYVRNLQ